MIRFLGTDDTQRNVTGTNHDTNRDQPCESNFAQLVAVASNDENLALSHSMTVRTSTCRMDELIALLCRQRVQHVTLFCPTQ